MSIPAQLVKELRERTGAGLMDCKRALVESDGDMDAAIEYLQIKGITKAAKKSGRVAAEGLIEVWVSEDQRNALMIEVNCETDFVSRNEQFQSFVKKLAEVIGPSDAETVEQALALPLDGKTVQDAITEQIAKIGENIQLRRLIRIKTDAGFVANYIHSGSQIGVFTLIEGELNEKSNNFGRDVAMHIAAMRPTYLDPSDVTEEAVAKQTEIFNAQVREEGKPENIIPRIVEGKLDKWRKENALYEQSFVKNPDQTVRDFEKETGDVKIARFERVEVGEGIEKVETNLAEEVAAQIKDR